MSGNGKWPEDDIDNKDYMRQLISHADWMCGLRSGRMKWPLDVYAHAVLYKHTRVEAIFFYSDVRPEVYVLLILYIGLVMPLIKAKTPSEFNCSSSWLALLFNS